MTLSDLKKLLNIDINDTEYDESLQLLLDASYKLLENEIGVKLQSADVTEHIRGNDNFKLSLSQYPVNTIIKVTEKNSKYEVIEEITSSVYYDTFRNNGVIERIDGKRFNSSFVYEVQYNAGFTTIPDDLEYCLRLLALSLNSQIDNIKDGVQRLVTPDGSFTYRDTIITPAIQTIIDKYRLIYL